jgi:hypothetical protein
MTGAGWLKILPTLASGLALEGPTQEMEPRQREVHLGSLRRGLVGRGIAPLAPLTS